MREITILRLDHRSFRDQRITSHVALTSRALGAKLFIYSGDQDSSLEKSINDVVDRWGGSMKIKYSKTVKSLIKNFQGIKIHLTMYGEAHQKTVEELNKIHEEPILLIVGGAKVPRYIYDIVDFNTSIGWQPHSEVAAISIILYELNNPEVLYKKYSDAKIKIDHNTTKRKRSDRFSK